MSLTSKWYQILNILLVKRIVPIDELSKMSNLSSQTLKKNIELLNEQLEEAAQIIQSKKIYELKIYHLENFQVIMTGKLKQEADFNSVGKRMAFILKKLVHSDEFVLIDDLSDMLQVSRGTVNKDIKLIKTQLMDFGVSLQGIPNKGIQIVGDEFNLRLIILKYVYDFYSDDYWLDQSSKDWANELAKIYKLDQTTLALLKKVVAISIHRILSKNPMEEAISYYNNFEYTSVAMQDFMIHLEKKYQLTLGKYDQDFISFPINTRTTAMVTVNNMIQYESGVREVFDEMMNEVRNNFITELDDDELFENLKYHLMFMLNRVIFHIELFDLFMDEIQLKYPFSYELAKVAISVIETKLMIPMNEIEVSYLTIYFELVLHKKKGQKEDKKVAIVCSTGRGTAALIHRQIKEVLGPDVLIVQYSEMDYQELRTQEYLAVFSTLPLPPKDGKPVIQITNLFDSQLLLEEWRKIDEQLLLTDSSIDFSFQVLDSDLSYLTNVKQMIEELIHLEKLDPTFLTLWEEREKRQTTIFDHGIGFPHTINKGSDKIIFRIGILKQKIINENQYVKIVFLVGIPEIIHGDVEKKLMEVYDLIFSLGVRTQSIDAISQLSTRQELLEYLKREEFI